MAPPGSGERRSGAAWGSGGRAGPARLRRAPVLPGVRRRRSGGARRSRGTETPGLGDDRQQAAADRSGTGTEGAAGMRTGSRSETEVQEENSEEEIREEEKGDGGGVAGERDTDR